MKEDKIRKLIVENPDNNYQKLQKTLKLTKQKYKTIVETAHDLIFITKNKKIVYANHSALRVLNYIEDELLGKPVSVLFPNMPIENDFKVCDCKMDGLFEELELQLVTKDGRIRCSLMSCSKIINEEEICILIAKDITKRKILEEERGILLRELENRNEKLEKLIKIKDDFLSIASHDLKAPFVTLLGYANLLLEDTNLSKKNLHYIKRIKKNAKEQLEYVNQLLSVLRLESRDIPLELEKTDIGKLIESCVSNSQILACHKSISLMIEHSINQIVSIDRAKIMQVINNLITNAIKFTPIGGAIYVSCFIENNLMKIHVKDTGIGISADKIPIIFDRYKRWHTLGTQGEEGTGLGLAICKNIIEIHKGFLEVESSLNQGSDFSFIIPLPQDKH